MVQHVVAIVGLNILAVPLLVAIMIYVNNARSKHRYLAFYDVYHDRHVYAKTLWGAWVKRCFREWQESSWMPYGFYRDRAPVGVRCASYGFFESMRMKEGTYDAFSRSRNKEGKWFN